ncbi:hypothetical protein MUA01_15205 [Enterobacteriaceae bacterium H18W14]|uniref:hypothetical protein n=1 Tax=Dryocola boscaweniae TaxID=2925397 RepID=UPI0022F0820F|nr:hypothetical protein [Dryocola boscaweniae]MCT4716309.1 hypothetical protein [Dryocola boscaweniae]
MQFRTAIKWLHGLTTLTLLIIVAGFLYLNSSQSESPDILKRSSQVNENTWLYMTEQNGGGATVSLIYRYYLSPKIDGSDVEIAMKLSTQEPLIVGAGTITDIRVDENNKINVKYSGKVFSITDKTTQVVFQIPHTTGK